MIRVTVMYNLPPGADEAAFLAWRLGEHQAANAAVGGVVTTDFARIDHEWSYANGLTPPKYRFMTVVDFKDRASFEAGFLADAADPATDPDMQRIFEPVFLVSEILTSTTAGDTL